LHAQICPFIWTGAIFILLLQYRQLFPLLAYDLELVICHYCVMSIGIFSICTNFSTMLLWYTLCNALMTNNHGIWPSRASHSLSVFRIVFVQLDHFSYLTTSTDRSTIDTKKGKASVGVFSSISYPYFIVQFTSISFIEDGLRVPSIIIILWSI
jgi:hypothetical protein